MRNFYGQLVWGFLTIYQVIHASPFNHGVNTPKLLVSGSAQEDYPITDYVSHLQRRTSGGKQTSSDPFQFVKFTRIPPESGQKFGRIEGFGPLAGHVSNKQIIDYAMRIGTGVKNAWEKATPQQKDAPGQKHPNNLPMTSVLVAGKDGNKHAVVISQGRPKDALQPGPEMQAILNDYKTANLKKSDKLEEHSRLVHAVDEAKQHLQQKKQAQDDANKVAAANPGSKDHSQRKTQARYDVQAAQKELNSLETRLQHLEHAASHKKEGKCAECHAIEKILRELGNGILEGASQVTVGVRPDVAGKEGFGVQEACASCRELQAQLHILDIGRDEGRNRVG